MRLRIAVLAVLVAALSLPVAAQAYIQRTTSPGDGATVKANGCNATRNADHSVTIACPPGHRAKLSWTLIGRMQPNVTVDCQPHACFYQPSVREVGHLHANNYIYSVTELVHHNRPVSMKAVFGGLSAP
jgi:hypothetical protein